MARRVDTACVPMIIQFTGKPPVFHAHWMQALDEGWVPVCTTHTITEQVPEAPSGAAGPTSFQIVFGLMQRPVSPIVIPPLGMWPDPQRGQG